MKETILHIYEGSKCASKQTDILLSIYSLMQHILNATIAEEKKLDERQGIIANRN